MNAAESIKEGRAALKRGDEAEGFRLFLVAAELGDADAQNSLGRMYSNGRGTPTDYAEAAKWFRRSAELGAIDSLYMLGCCYDQGEGVPKDNVSAHVWLSLAAATGYERAMERLARVAKRMTPTQITEAEKLARDSGIQPIIPPCPA